LVVGGGKVLNSLTPWGLEVPNPPSRDSLRLSTVELLPRGSETNEHPHGKSGSGLRPVRTIPMDGVKPDSRSGAGMGVEPRVIAW
jgi:hypothetical protein